MTRLRILFDADDVTENLLERWLSALNERYGTAVTAEDVTDWDISLAFPTLSKQQVYGILQEDQVWKNLMPVHGAQEYLQRLHDEGHELYMVTATDFRWLDPEHIIIAHCKQMVCGDVLIDDAPHNLVGGPYFRILYDRPHNRKFKERKYSIYRAKDWEQVYSLIHDNLLA